LCIFQLKWIVHNHCNNLLRQYCNNNNNIDRSVGNYNNYDQSLVSNYKDNADNEYVVKEDSQQSLFSIGDQLIKNIIINSKSKSK
jgi:hypothetical protein